MHDRPDSNLRNPENPDLDRLIEAALNTYANPDSGLEQRVLARIAASRQPQPRLRWIAWTAALTAAACVLLLFVLMHKRPAASPAANAVNTPPAQQTPKAEARIELQPAQKRTGAPHHAQAKDAVGNFAANRLPKRDIFPTPHPLSPAEQVLVDFAARAPQAQREAFLDDRNQSSGPIAIAAIRIAPIQIPPIEPPSSGNN